MFRSPHSVMFALLLLTAADVAHADVAATVLYQAMPPAGFYAAFPNGNTRAFGGQLIGNAMPGQYNYNYNAVLWSNTGAVTNLNPAGYTISQVGGLDATQQVGYGSGALTSNNNHALLWSGNSGSAVDLNPTGFTSSQAMGINGSYQVGSGVINTATHALLWNGSAGSAVDLNPVSYASSTAIGVAGGVQVGYATPSGGSNALPVMWTGTAGSIVNLTPAGMTYGTAYATDGTYEVGYASSPGLSYNSHAFLWSGSASSAVDLTPVGYSFAIAYGVGNGMEFGYGYISGSYSAQALVWFGTAASAIDLESLLPANLTTSYAYGAVGNTIYGYAYDANNNPYAVAWTISAVPEPASVSMLGLAAVALVRRRRTA